MLDDAAAAFLSAVHEQDLQRARHVLDAEPRIASSSVHVAAALGRVDDVSRLVAEDPKRVTQRVGRSGGDPLLFLCHSPFHGESAERDAGLLATARVLLAAGGDPNAREATYGLPALFAVTGQRSLLPIARLLLDAGANPPTASRCITRPNDSTRTHWNCCSKQARISMRRATGKIHRSIS